MTPTVCDQGAIWELTLNPTRLFVFMLQAKHWVSRVLTDFSSCHEHEGVEPLWAGSQKQQQTIGNLLMNRLIFLGCFNTLIEVGKLHDSFDSAE